MSPRGGSADIADALGRAERLLAELSGLGVVLSIEGDRLAFDAPAGVLGDSLLARMRAERAGLLAVLRGDVAPEPVAHVAAVAGPVIRSGQSALTVEGAGGTLWPIGHKVKGDCRADPAGCPSCGGGPLVDDPGGVRCGSCDLLAWVESDGGGLVRVDAVGGGAVDPDSVPICPGCGRWCDVLTLAESWRCSRCDPEADERRRRTSRVLALVDRSRGRAVASDRRAVR